ncbi:DUF2834 domain-containing protein [Hydrococcus rivularis NIES-593]|uniref:DUF2834 domain-containing protein n=1 Tax=Hydrococcus rivularis NIES-593 TaxID=1921803 RepID=A0A1U7HMI2_9CYAN|nr:DUF2834 domain-containing protein [Hydrococcus rivularis]OKH24764.1 DUF2834 domain-containing protein [Hydrococcus rivularis NIES-593]
MFAKISFWLLWVGLIGYAFFLAPPNQPNTFELIIKLSTGAWEGINPLIIALFNLMGIFPLIYACLLFIDGRGQKIKAFPFVLGSFGVGAFAILPYLALRNSNPEFSGKKDWLIKILDSRLTGIILTIGTVILLVFGFSQGDWGDFVRQWQTSRFIHVMSLDFCFLCLLFPSLLNDDLARREIKNPLIFWVVSLIPLLGALVYLCLRPPLPDKSLATIPSTQQSAGN